MFVLRFSPRIVLALSGFFALIAANGSPVKVPYATPINVHVRAEILSSTAHVGDQVPIEVADDVVISGFVVFSKGADGVAEVTSVTPAAANSVGQVQLAFKWVHCVDGSKIGVTGQQGSAAGSATASSRSGPSTSDVQNAVSQSGVNSTALSQTSNILGRATNVFGSLTAHAKGPEGSIEPDRKMTIAVRNPAGVTIVSTLKSIAPDDSDIK